MFRPLARIKQQLPDAECVEILKSAKRGVLSLVGDGGYPYGIPLNHFYDERDGHLYFHGGKRGHRVDAARACDKASYCVLDDGTKAPDGWWLVFRSVIVFGRLREVSDPERTVDLCRRLSLQFTKDTGYIEDEIKRFAAATLCFELVPERICGKRVTER